MFDSVLQKSDTRQKTVACYTGVKKWEFVEHENTYIIPFFFLFVLSLYPCFFFFFFLPKIVFVSLVVLSL